MRYKLLKQTKQLTKEDFFNSKWKLDNIDQVIILVNEAIKLKAHPTTQPQALNMFQQLFFPKECSFADCYYKKDATEEELNDNFESYYNHKEMHFFDWFYDESKSLEGEDQILAYAQGSDNMESILSKNKMKILCGHYDENKGFVLDLFGLEIYLCPDCNKDLQSQMEEQAAQEAAK